MLFLLLAGIGVYLYLNKNQFIEKQILQEIQSFDLPADSLVVDYEEGILELINFNALEFLFPDHVDSLTEKGKAFYIRKMRLHTIDWWKIKRNKLIKTDSLLLHGLDISLTQADLELRKSDGAIKITGLSVDHILMDSINVNWEDSTSHFNGRNINVAWSNLPLINKDFDLQYLGLPQKCLMDEGSFKSNSGTEWGLDWQSIRFIQDSLLLTKILFNHARTRVNASALSIEEIQKLNSNNFHIKRAQLNRLTGKLNIDELKRLLKNGEKKDWIVRCKEFRMEGDNLSVSTNNKNYNIPRCYGELEDILFENSRIKIDNYSGSINSFHSNQEIPFHTVSTGDIRFSKEKLSIKNFSIDPNISRPQFARTTGKSRSLYNLKISDIDMELNIFDFLTKKSLQFASMDLNGAVLEIYSDLNIPKPQHEKKILTEIIQEIDIPFSIHDISVKNGFLLFEMKGVDREKAGKINVNALSAYAKNVTNIKSLIQQDPRMSVGFQGKLMNKGECSLDLNFDLQDDHFAYQYKGKIGPMSLQEFNPMLIDLTASRIKEGYMQGMEFTVNANEFNGTGNMEFYYENVKMRYVEERTTGKIDPIRMFLNHMVLRQNNRKGRRHKDGKIEKERDTSKTMYYHIWECIFDGIRSVMLPKPLERLN